MSTINEWIGSVEATFDTWTLSLTGTASGPGTLSVKVGARPFSAAFVAAETAAAVLQRLSDLLASSTAPEAVELSYSTASVTPDFTATSTVAGRPVTVNTYAVTAAVGFSGATLAHTIVATGPNYANNVANWSLGHKPGANVNEEARIATGPDILYGLDGMYDGTHACDATRVMASFQGGSMGLPKRNARGNAGYAEYRQTYVDLTNAGTVYIGEGDGSGIGLFRGQLAAGQIAHVYKTSTPLEENAPAVDFGSGGAAPGSVHAYGGSSVGYGWVLPAPDTLPAASVVGQTSLFYTQSRITALTVRDGLALSMGRTDALAIQGGNYVQEQGQIDTIVADGGIVRLNHDQGSNQIAATFRGSISGEPPVLDATGNDRGGKILANTSSFRGGAYILNPYRNVTVTSVSFDRQSLSASVLGSDVYGITVV